MYHSGVPEAGGGTSLFLRSAAEREMAELIDELDVDEVRENVVKRSLLGLVDPSNVCSLGSRVGAGMVFINMFLFDRSGCWCMRRDYC
jgi:hypothetical protein